MVALHGRDLFRESVPNRMLCCDIRKSRPLARGLRGIAVKSHGGSDAIGFANAIGVAVDMKVNGFLDKIRDGSSTLAVLQAPIDKPQSAAL